MFSISLISTYLVSLSIVDMYSTLFHVKQANIPGFRADFVVILGCRTTTPRRLAMSSLPVPQQRAGHSN